MRVVDNIIQNLLKAFEALYSQQLPIEQFQIQKTKKEFDLKLPKNRLNNQLKK